MSTSPDSRLPLYRPILPTGLRVVHLLPSLSFDDEILCVLETRPPGLKTRYKALSWQWGTSPSKRPIRVAPLDNALQARPQPSPQEAYARAVAAALSSTVRKYSKFRKIAVWAISTFFFKKFYFGSEFRQVFEPPTWAARVLSHDACLLLWAMASGLMPHNLLSKAWALAAELAVTKPWNVTSDFCLDAHPDVPGKFRRVEVPVNLEVALRYMREERRPVALWIDALCINQTDEDEKQVQIQRMDWIYANAAPVVVWLGGYHDTERPPPGLGCVEEMNCRHRKEMEAAFELIESEGGRRHVLDLFKGGATASRSAESLAGVCELHRRGWWERLWVIQEVALATGPVQMQCGHQRCDLDSFWNAHYNIRLAMRHDKDISLGSRAAEHFRLVTNDFKFSEFDDVPKSQKAIADMVSVCTDTVFASFGTDIHDDKTEFRKQDFHARMERLLLRTAGKFKCHRDRDRFYGVFGIAVGSRAGQLDKTRNFIRSVSSLPTTIALGWLLDPLFKSWGRPGTLVAICSGLLIVAWVVYYDRHAKHWAIMRPEYVVEFAPSNTHGSWRN
jgi:hypothetical protein